MKRRRYLRAGGAVGAAALAGCGGLFETTALNQPPVLEDRPDAAYVPTHVEGMAMIGMAEAGRLRLALSYSFPHRFWLMDGDATNQVEIADDDSVHLMLSAWDAETGVAIPSSAGSFLVRRDGEAVADRTAWPMLSQNMGFHFGDNVPLEGDGTYEVEVTFGPVTARRTGAFQDALGEQVTRTFEFEYSQEARDEISYETLEDRQGERDAVDPMSMDMMPIHQLPPAEELGGTVLGQGSHADATIVATRLDSAPEGVDGDGPYLAVSPRTPYNRYPIPLVSLSATVEGADGQRFDGPLEPTLDSDLSYHHGAVVEDLAVDDAVTVTVESAAGVSRHEGYETAFLDAGSVSLGATGST